MVDCSDNAIWTLKSEKKKSIHSTELIEFEINWILNQTIMSAGRSESLAIDAINIQNSI